MKREAKEFQDEMEVELQALTADVQTIEFDSEFNFRKTLL